MTYGTSLFDQAIKAKSLKELREVHEEANRRIGKRAPADQEEFLVMVTQTE
jgi:hypothetical protein